LKRETKTGVSIVEASIGKFDAGDLVCQKEVDIEPFHRFKELSLILSHLGAETTLEFLKNFESFHKNKKPQDENLSSKAKLILDSNFAYLDFTKMTNEEILTLYRSFFGSQLEPFTKANIQGKERFVFFDNLFQVTNSSENFKLLLNKINPISKPGDFFWDLKHDRNSIFIKSKNGWLVTNKIKLDGITWTEGEKIITKTFLNQKFTDKSNKTLAVHCIPKIYQVVKPEFIDGSGAGVRKIILERGVVNMIGNAEENK